MSLSIDGKKRVRSLNVRLTIEELDEIKRKSEETHLGLSGYSRYVLIHANPNLEHKPCKKKGCKVCMSEGLT